MTADRPDRESGEDFLDETLGPAPPESDPLSPAPPPGEEAFGAAGDIDSDAGPEVTEPIAPEPPAGGESAEPPPNVDPPAGQDTGPTSEDEPKRPKPATESDWSNFVPAPGYADPETGRPVFRWGIIDQAGKELMLLVEGERPVFEPEKAKPGDAQGPPPPPDFLAGAFRGGGEPPRDSSSRAGGAAPSVSVEIRVTLSDEEMERVSKDTLRRAAEFSRTELMIVARKLYELDNELIAKEHQRQILARQY